MVTKRLIVTFYNDLFTYKGCEWICVGGKNAGRIAVVDDLACLIWKDSNENVTYEENKRTPFVPRLGY